MFRDMPKLPLFKDEPLNQGIIAKLRAMREHPEVGDNATLLNDLAVLRWNPDGPMSERLACFAVDAGLLPNVMLGNFLFNTVGQPRMTGKRAVMRFEINQWLLVHARAAGVVEHTRLV